MAGRRTAPRPVTVAVLRTGCGDAAANEVAKLVERTAARRVLRCPNGGSARALILVPLGPSTLPSAPLVHDAVDLLADLGWSHIGVGGRLSHRETDLGDDAVDTVLTRHGYGGTTGRGRAYDVLDLSASVSSPCPDVSVLAGRPVSADWTDAALRLVVTRWSDDPEELFVAATSALLGCAGDIPGARRGDVAADVVRYLPPAFTVVEAQACDDSTALVASTDVVLTDTVTAVLRGVDPAASPVLGACLHAHGLPPGYRLAGDVEPLAPRRTEARLVADSLRQLGDRLPGAGRTMRVLMSGDAPRDADVDEVLSWLQRTIGPLVQPSAATAPMTVGTIGYGLGGVAESLAAWRTNFAKDDVSRLVVPLGFDPARFAAAEYTAIPGYLATFTTLLDAAQPDDSWLRWCYFDGSVLFDVHRVVNARYEDFVERVDVAEGISLMADYLGGRRTVVERDDSGRPVRQAERNIYLPQPNYLAFWGGKPIDVCKIELVEYGDAVARLYWRTVDSPNDSATYDDGQLTFADAGEGRTRIAISGRQHFQLPLFWQAVDLDRFPALKNELVTDAYRRFFSATFDNFEACFEGREFRIGVDASGPSPIRPTEALSTYLDIAREWLAERGAQRGGDHTVDDHGFRHFPGVDGHAAPEEKDPAWRRAARQFTEEYLVALRQDAERVPRW